MGFEIDDGQLDGISRENCFVLGYEYATIEQRIKQGQPFVALIHAKNAGRIFALCSELDAIAAISWMAEDCSEDWNQLSFKGLNKNL